MNRLFHLDILDSILSYLDIQSIGKLDIAFTNKAERSEWLKCLCRYHYNYEVIINNKKDGFGKYY